MAARILAKRLLATSSSLSHTAPLVRRTPVSLHSMIKSQMSSSSKKKGPIKVTFIKADGTRLTAHGKIGQNLLDVIIDNEVDIDGFGACEGTLACSTCHLIFKKEDYDRLGDEPTDEELDMLDLAYGLTETSRLGCQVCLSKELDGLEVQVPEGVNDQR